MDLNHGHGGERPDTPGWGRFGIGDPERADGNGSERSRAPLSREKTGGPDTTTRAGGISRQGAAQRVSLYSELSPSARRRVRLLSTTSLLIGISTLTGHSLGVVDLGSEAAVTLAPTIVGILGLVILRVRA